MTSEDTWAQTLITITPEDDAVLREIAGSTLVSGPTEVPLNLSTENIIYRTSLTYKSFLGSNERDSGSKDAENQTYLQGVPIVDIPVQYKEEAVQTMYMSAPCPPLEYFKGIMTSMNDVPMPTWKETKATQTIINFLPETVQEEVIKQLSENLADEDRILQQEFISDISDEELAEMEVIEIMNFIMTRVFWISDPTSQVQAPMKHAQTETAIKFNYRINTLLTDNETQTGLTCEPKESNTKLLSDYQETKSMISCFLEECLSRAIESRIIIDDIVDEIISKCADKVRYPMKEQITQTLASYKLHEVKEEDILRKLKLEVIVDPFEASIIVVPLTDDLLKVVCEAVSKNASIVVKDILQMILRRVSVIVAKLAEIRKESQPISMDKIFDQRRKKILQSMMKKETDTISTQTGIAGVPEIIRTKEPKEVVCSICRRHSLCDWCLSDQDSGDAPQEKVELIRTQDILLAYQPCYVVATPSEQEKNKNLLLSRPPRQDRKQLPVTPFIVSDHSSDRSSETVDIVLRPMKRMKPQDSISGWAHTANATLTKPWSTKGSTNNSSKTTTISSGNSMSTFQCNEACKSKSSLSAETEKALHILKSTFCNRDSCTSSARTSFESECTCNENIGSCTRSTCDICSGGSNTTINEIFTKPVLCTHNASDACKTIYPLQGEQNSYRNLCTTYSNLHRTPGEPCDDGFKVIPICQLNDSDS